MLVLPRHVRVVVADAESLAAGQEHRRVRVAMTDNAYSDDPRKVAELAAEWKAGPRDGERRPIDRLSEVRSALFSKLHTPESIRRPKNKR
jgi:hypothetical protein